MNYQPECVKCGTFGHVDQLQCPSCGHPEDPDTQVFERDRRQSRVAGVEIALRELEEVMKEYPWSHPYVRYAREKFNIAEFWLGTLDPFHIEMSQGGPAGGASCEYADADGGE